MKREMLFLPLVLLVIALAGCDGGNNTGKADGVAISFIQDAPPAVVYDNSQFLFDVAVKIENKGESAIPPGHLKVELSGISKDDFGGTGYRGFNENELRKTYTDSSGTVVAGDTDYIYLREFNYNKNIRGNEIPFVIRADVCYHYQTVAIAKICVKKQFSAPGEVMVCNVNEAKAVDVSSAPVTVTNFREMPGGSKDGKTRISFSFDIETAGKGTAYKHYCGGKSSPSNSICAGYPANTDTLCLAQITSPTERMQQTNRINVWVDTGISGKLDCSGLTLEAGRRGDIQLYQGKRTITCIQDITDEERAYERPVTIQLEYDYDDFIEAPVVVKHVGG